MPSTGRITVGTLTRQAERHSAGVLALRRTICFFLGHHSAPSFRSTWMEADACTFCCRIIEVRTGHDERQDAE